MRKVYYEPPPIFPYTWAAEWGEDQYGLWQAFIYKDVRYVFRWIESGKFLMGSPEDEPERNAEGNIIWGAETQHPVTLTEGFWLGETAVTQALWQVVTGKNPSHFNDNEQNPVERISWDDSITFIEQLNNVLSQAHTLVSDPFTLRLPTKAEWEYACRAGTETPFYFGNNITTDLVNYDGNYSYDKAEKGEYRKKTMPVKSFPCNAWGLYEMHGNVWEWCQDWFVEDLGATPVVDPSGAKEGSYRVVRGGSWYYHGRNARLAMRNFNSPVSRNDFIGLRLALG